MTAKTVIRGMGFYAPDQLITNQDLEKLVDTSDEWIMTRTGIRTRHIVAPGESCSDMGLVAARRALADAGYPVEKVTHLLVATLTPDGYCPSTASYLTHKLGIKDIMSIDVNAACSGFLNAVQVARAMVALDPKACVLAVASDVLTSRVNWTDRATCVLFGDAAGAVIITAADDQPAKCNILDVMLKCDGAHADLLTVRGGGSGRPYRAGETIGDDFFIQMNGREVYKHAVRNMSAISEEILEKNGWSKKDVDVLVPHQANLRIVESLGRRLEMPSERVFVNVDRYGNTSAASLAVALAEAFEQGFIKAGNRVLAVTFGGGFTWGAALLEF